jgi:polyhydroxyalkanoate synthesis regulator phasin
LEIKELNKILINNKRKNMMNVEQEIQNINRQLNKLKLGISNPSVPLPKYRGRLDERDFPEFIKEFNRAGNVMGWDEAKSCRILPYCLENDAAAAYENIADNVIKTDWQRLVDTLATMLARSNDLGFQRRKLMELKQGKETPLEFAIKIRELVSRAYPTGNGYNELQRDQMATDYFINGLWNELQTEVMRHNPPNLAEAIKVANRELNIIERKSNANRPNKDIEQLNEQIRKLNDKIDINYIRNGQINNREINYEPSRRFMPFRRFWKGRQNNYRPNTNNFQTNSNNYRPNGNKYGPKNNFNSNNFRSNPNQNNTQNRPKRSENKAKRRGGYSINAATVTEALLPTLMIIMAIFISSNTRMRNKFK